MEVGQYLPYQLFLRLTIMAQHTVEAQMVASIIILNQRKIVQTVIKSPTEAQKRKK